MSTDATTTPFDGSTPRPADSPPATDAYAAPPAAAESVELSGLSALDALDAQIQERDEEEESTTLVEIPGLDGVRLVCSTVVPYDDYQRWQKAAIPPADRKKKRLNGLSMSQMVLACMVLRNTCEAIEHRVGKQWQPMLGTDGEPFTLESDELLRRYGIIDPDLFVKRLFGRDPAVLAAGETVMKASGWLEDDDDDTDPTA
jgi:hypothetical protein